MKAAFLTVVCGVLMACGPGARPDQGNGPDSGGECALACSGDLHAVVDCHGNVVSECADADACDPTNFQCSNACTAAEANKRSVGCNYYATDMDVSQPTYCFAAFVANTWSRPAKISVEYMGQQLNVATFTRLPTGSGPSLTYAPYDPNVGVPPGEVAVLFLSGESGAAPLCPTPTAVPDAGRSGTGIFNSFKISTDVPVVA